MKLPYIVTVWAETHSRATYLITDLRIIHFKQHLSFFLLPLVLALSSGEWDKQANMHADHKPLSWSLACVCVQRLQFTRFVYYFAWLLMVWFSLCTSRCVSCHQARPASLRDAWVVACRDLCCCLWCSHSTNKREKDQQGNQLAALPDW